MSAVSMRGWAGALGCLSALALASPASAAPQTPDVYVYDVGVNGSNVNDIHYYGQDSGIAGYSIATQSCNGGDAQLDWYQNPDTRHPVIGQREDVLPERIAWPMRLHRGEVVSAPLLGHRSRRR